MNIPHSEYNDAQPPLCNMFYLNNLFNFFLFAHIDTRPIEQLILNNRDTQKIIITMQIFIINE